MASHRSIVLSLGLALSASFALSSGCNESNTLSKDEAAKESARVICDLYFSCSCPDWDDPDRFTSSEQCQAELEGDAQRAIDEGDEAELIYDGKCVNDVIDIYNDLGCQTSLSLDDLIRLSEDVTCKMYYGDVAAGSACTNLVESNGDDCEKDLVCENNICVVRDTNPGPGEACDTPFSPCSGGAVCLDLDEDGNSMCEPVPGKGETCLGQADICDEGLACDQGSKTCGDAPGDGEPCSMSAWPFNRCATGTVCDSTDTTCKTLPGGGEDCVDNQCADGFMCDNGVCAEDSPLICDFT